MTFYMGIHRCIYYEESASTQPRTSPRKNLGELPIHRFRNTNIIYEGFFRREVFAVSVPKLTREGGEQFWKAVRGPFARRFLGFLRGRLGGRPAPFVRTGGGVGRGSRGIPQILEGLFSLASKPNVAGKIRIASLFSILRGP